jgi:hypothetical protein
MNQYTYDHEVITMTNQLLNSFNNIIINRFNNHRETRDKIKIRLVYAPKQRVLHDLINKDQTIRLPVIAVQIKGVTRDQERVTNKLLGNYYNLFSSTDLNNVHDRTPLPVDISYGISVMTRYQEDMDQILSHLTPYVNPYFVVSWRTPKRPNHEIRSRVYWDGNINVDYPVDIASTVVARVVADLTFTFKGWIFQDGPYQVSNAKQFITNYATVSAIDSNFVLDTTNLMYRH